MLMDNPSLTKPYIDKLPLSTSDFEQIKEIAEFGIEAYKKDSWISPQTNMTDVFKIEAMFKMRGEVDIDDSTVAWHVEY